MKKLEVPEYKNKDMNRIFIDNYRGFDIEFDKTDGTFKCAMTKERTKQSTSYKAVTKAIDEFRKDNENFQPVGITVNLKEAPYYSKYRQTGTIVGVRKDGKLMVEWEDESRGILSRHDLSRYMLANPKNAPILVQLEQLAEEERESAKVFREKRTALKEELEITPIKALAADWIENNI